MATKRVFNDLTGNENVINALEALVVELKAQGITGFIQIPDTEHHNGYIDNDFIIVVVAAYDEENLNKIIDFFMTYENPNVDIRPLPYEILQNIKSESYYDEVYGDYRGYLVYDF